MKLRATQLPSQARLQIRRQIQSQTAAFPGATAPGTGARHFPDLHPEQSGEDPRERSEKFEMKTTEDYYRDFPGLVRASTPLYIKSAGPQEPLGVVEQTLEDAGPQTGHRKMPSTVDLEGRLRPRFPSHPEDSEELQRERDLRHKLL